MIHYEEIQSLIPKLPHKLRVRFALSCAKDVFPLVRYEEKEAAKACIDTVELWLKDKATAEECFVAADAAWSAPGATNASNSGAHAAWAAANAAYITHAADAGRSAAWAAASCSTNNITFIEATEKYLRHLKTIIEELTTIEKTLFNLE
jgi:hypothetical protein